MPYNVHTTDKVYIEMAILTFYFEVGLTVIQTLNQNEM